MLSESEAVALVKDDLQKRLHDERSRLAWIDKWARWDQEEPKAPKNSTAELKALLRLARTPWLYLVIATAAQAMYVDGYRSPRAQGDAAPWRTWLANGFPMRQTGVTRATLTYGYTFLTVTPGVAPDGGKRSVMRGVSPKSMYCAWEDPAADEWPLYALHDAGKGRYFVYDDQLKHELRVESSGRLEHVGAEWHESGVCPVARVCNTMDLEGRCVGEVEPFIDLHRRINKTVYDRLMVQHFNSWKVRTVSGMAEPETDGEAERAKLLLRQNDILIAEDSDTKFGTLDETPMDGFVMAWRADLESLAAVSQTPTYQLTGQLVNLAADALAAARAPLTQKIAERQNTIGGAYNQALRLAALQEGDLEAARDVAARVTWQDMEIRSLAQAVDAYGKAASMLGVPARALWGRIPGITKSDVDEWERMAAQSDPVTKMLERTFGAGGVGSN